jgi:hypothetical protein
MYIKLMKYSLYLPHLMEFSEISQKSRETLNLKPKYVMKGLRLGAKTEYVYIYVALRYEF